MGGNRSGEHEGRAATPAQPQIWIENDTGLPIRHVTKDQPIEIVHVVPDDGTSPPDSIDVSVDVGDESATVSLSYRGSGAGRHQYRIEEFTLDSEFTVTNGEAVTVTSPDGGGATTGGHAYEVNAARDTGRTMEHLQLVFENWLAFSMFLRDLGSDDPEILAARQLAATTLQNLSHGIGQVRALADGELYDRWGRARAVALHVAEAIPPDPRQALEDGEVAMDPRVFADRTSKAIDFYEDGVHDLYTHVLGQTVMGTYQGYVQYSGGDVYWTGLTGVYAKYDAWRNGDEEWLEQTGTDEFGRAKGLTQLGVEIVVDKLVDRAVDIGVGRLTGGPDLPIARPGTASPAAKATGRGHVQAPEVHGVQPWLVPRFQAVANEFDVMIALRPGNPDSMPWQLHGFPPKSTEIKTKTLKDVDAHIGGPASSGYPDIAGAPTGLVGHFDPRLPERPAGIPDDVWDRVANGGRRPDGVDAEAWAAMADEWAAEVRHVLADYRPTGVSPAVADQLVKRFIQRRLEFTDHGPGLRRLADDGLVRLENGMIIDTGLYGGTGKPITGDLDVYEVVGRDGAAVGYEVYRSVITALSADPTSLVVHGAHMRWPVDAPFARPSKEAKIFDGINAGHQHEPVLLIGYEDGLVRSTFVRETGSIDGNPYELITTGDGRVLWAGGFITRPAPLALPDPRMGAIDPTTRAGMVAKSVPLPYLINEDRADPAEGTAPVDPDDSAADAFAAEKARLDDFFAAMVDQGPPTYEGDPSLLGDDEGSGDQADTSAPEPFDPTTWRPDLDPAVWEPDGAFGEIVDVFRIVGTCEPCERAAHGLAVARARVWVLERELTRLQSAGLSAWAHDEVQWAVEQARRQATVAEWVFEDCERRLCWGQDRNADADGATVGVPIEHAVRPLAVETDPGVLPAAAGAATQDPAPDELFPSRHEPRPEPTPAGPAPNATFTPAAETKPGKKPIGVAVKGALAGALVGAGVLGWALFGGGGDAEPVSAASTTPVPTEVATEVAAAAPLGAADQEPDAEPAADPSAEPAPEPTLEPSPTPVPTATPTPEPPVGGPASLGLAGAIDLLPDPPGGQTGSDERVWFVDPRADIVEFGAVPVAFGAGVRAQAFENTSFPCGADTADYTVTCPIGAAAFADDDAVVFHVRVAEPIEPGGGTLQYGLAADVDGDSTDNYFGQEPFALDLFNDTELWWRLEIDADGTRHVWVDGVRDGVPGVPRYSAAAVIESGDTLLWVIPRSELPGETIRYRLTTFFNTLPPDEIPSPETSGGDVSGLDVSSLETVPAQVVSADDLDALPPDVDESADGIIERDDDPVEDPDATLTAALVDRFSERMNAAFATGDTEPVRRLMHFLSRAGSADGCQALIERSFPDAERIVLTDVVGPLPSEFLAVYQATAVVTYPTGETSFPTALAPDIDGRLAMLTQC